MPSGNPNPNIGHTPKVSPQGVNNRLPDAFHADIDPSVHYKRESYRHRIMVQLAQEGYQQNEIAKMLDASVFTVSNVLRQPWARERMQNGMNKTLEQSLREMKQEVVTKSLENVIRIANDDSGKTKAETVLAANVKLLDRFLGTPTQHIEQVISGDPSQIPDEALARLVEAAATPQEN